MKRALALLFLFSCLAFGQASNAGRISGTGTQLFVTNPQTSAYQVIPSDFEFCKTIPVASGTFTITLVASTSQPNNGECIWIINYGSGTVTVSPSGQNLNVNGATGNQTLTQGQGLWIVSDATNYEGQFFSPGTSTLSFTNITSGTNTTATMTVGSGASLTFSGTGIVNADEVNGATIGASISLAGTNASKQIIAATAGGIAAVNYAAGGGTANAQTATYSPAIASLVIGLAVYWLPSNANTSTTPTFAPNGLSAATIIKQGGGALAASDLTTTAIAFAVYDGTDWELQNPQTGNPSTSVAFSAITTATNTTATMTVGSGASLTFSGTGIVNADEVNGATIGASISLAGTNASKQIIAATAGGIAAVNYAAGGGTANAQTATYSPAIASLVTGLAVYWLPSNANTTTTPTFAPNGLTAKTIIKVGGAAVAASDLTTTAIAYAIYDGTSWELQNPQTTPSSLCSAISSPTANQIVMDNGSGCPADATSSATLSGFTNSGQSINTLNGAASTPPGIFKGTWYSGGTGTTTKPQVLIECNSGTTTSTGWNTAGSGLGVNACSGFTGNLIDVQLNGTAKFQADYFGRIDVSAGTIYMSSTGGSGDSINMAGTGSGAVMWLTPSSGSTVSLSWNSPNSASDPLLQNVHQTNPILKLLAASGAATAQLQVAGTQATGTGDVSLCWTTTGLFTQGSVCGTSLLRDKTLLSPFENGLDYALGIQPWRYIRNATGKEEIGLIADWTAAVDPLLGTYNSKTGDLANVSDRALISVLISAIQEQQREIETMKKEKQ